MGPNSLESLQILYIEHGSSSSTEKNETQISRSSCFQIHKISKYALYSPAIRTSFSDRASRIFSARASLALDNLCIKAADSWCLRSSDHSILTYLVYLLYMIHMMVYVLRIHIVSCFIFNIMQIKSDLIVSMFVSSAQAFLQTHVFFLLKTAFEMKLKNQLWCSSSLSLFIWSIWSAVFFGVPNCLWLRSCRCRNSRRSRSCISRCACAANGNGTRNKKRNEKKF